MTAKIMIPTRRWEPKRIRVWCNEFTGKWWATDECGDDPWAGFENRTDATDWAFRNWENCTGCKQFAPFHPEYGICRSCGRARGQMDSRYNELVESLGKFMFSQNYYGPGWDDPEEDQELVENYRADAREIIAAYPHLLDLGTRESLLVEDGGV